MLDGTDILDEGLKLWGVGGERRFHLCEVALFFSDNGTDGNAGRVLFEESFVDGVELVGTDFDGIGDEEVGEVAESTALKTCPFGEAGGGNV